MPPSFHGVEPGQRFDVALPTGADGLLAEDGAGRLANMTAWWLTPTGRLKDGWFLETGSAASAHLAGALLRRVGADHRSGLTAPARFQRQRPVDASE